MQVSILYSVSSISTVNSTLRDRSSSPKSFISDRPAALPNFVYAMPVQLVILGITMCLLGMLLIHLLFTIRYHLPLSKMNYALQVSFQRGSHDKAFTDVVLILQTGATMLSLANIAIQLRLVMVDLYNNGRQWPFMFDYSELKDFLCARIESRSLTLQLPLVEISLPDDDWTKAQRGGWLCMQGLNALIVHSTHIQFLTMLFPSSLEARLILGLLGSHQISRSSHRLQIIHRSCSQQVHSHCQPSHLASLPFRQIQQSTISEMQFGTLPILP